MSNYITDKIKTPIKEVLKSDEMFNKTHITLESIFKLRSNVFNTYKQAIAINIESTKGVNCYNYCDDIDTEQQLIISYHALPSEKTNEDELNLIGLKIVKLISNAISNGGLFNYQGISLNLINRNPITVGRMYERTKDKGNLHSDAVVIRYDLKYSLTEV